MISIIHLCVHGPNVESCYMNMIAAAVSTSSFFVFFVFFFSLFFFFFFLTFFLSHFCSFFWLCFFAVALSKSVFFFKSTSRAEFTRGRIQSKMIANQHFFSISFAPEWKAHLQCIFGFFCSNFLLCFPSVSFFFFHCCIFTFFF